MIQIYNTLTRSVENFTPLHPPKVSLYTCGPTVYDNAHIGHMRRYVGDDILVRTLTLNGYNVNHVMNITDVGHLVSDDDAGEDKMEKGARKHGMSVWDIAKRFEEQFFQSTDALGIKKPQKIMHATKYIAEQIALIKILEEKGYTYKIEDGIYFDSTKFSTYFKLSRQNPDDLKSGARVEMVPGKKHPTDFALWKFSPVGEQRQMEWESPWGVGFPGWHIECSAMSMASLGETLDIHTGGIDHITIHHTNEIAQSEAATGKEFVKYWVHHAFLMVDGQKMSKSLGNLYTVQDVTQKGFDPLALRYLFLQTHYRQEMNFTWDALDASQTALKRLRNEYAKLDKPSQADTQYIEKFTHALSDDLNTSQGLAIVWELLKSDLSSATKAATLNALDVVLGLDLQKQEEIAIPEEVQKLLLERKKAREEKDFAKSDALREKIQKLGFTIEDKNDETVVKKYE